MNITIHPTNKASGEAAAEAGALLIRQTIAEKGEARIILATGTSQFEMLSHLLKQSDIDWQQVTGFHLDEYVGLPISHQASFRKYLWERFIRLLSTPMKAFHYVNAEHDPEAEIFRLSKLVNEAPIDVAFVGIGENGHLAFNDPPADFDTEDPFIIVTLDDACRLQQFNEGWFESMEAVPMQAISMSIQQIMQTHHLICTVTEKRKAKSVRDAIRGPVTPRVPASILQHHTACQLFLDRDAAALLE